MAKPTPIILTMLTLVVAGCVNVESLPDDVQPGATTVVPVERILPYLDLSEDHNHGNASQHRSGWNLDIIGHSILAESYEELGQYNHVVLNGDLAYVSAYRVSPSQEPGLIIVDVADPTNPVVLGSVTNPDTTPIDVFLSDDGRYAFLASHRLENGVVALPSSCTGTPAMNVCAPFLPYGVQIVDVQDPTNPQIVGSYTSAPAGAHTVKYHEIGGEGYVFIASYGFTSFNRIVAGVEIARFVEDPDGAHLEFVSRYTMGSPPTEGRSFVHDMWVEEHPVTGDLLMYVSHWDSGVRVVDVSDPAMPREIAAWDDFDAAIYGNIHFARPYPELIDGVHITVAAPEYGSAEHAGKFWILDTTDPTAPKTLGQWTVPGDPFSDSNYRYSPHNFDFKDGLMVYAHYHGGVWVMDISDSANWSDPKPVAFRFTVPDEDVILPDDAPRVWNAVFREDGRIVASDITSGLYVLEIGTRAPGAPPYEGLV